MTMGHTLQRTKRTRTVNLRFLPNVEDRSFLPPAMGLVETPPSPIKIALMLTICFFATAALTWSWFGHLDVLASARGAIEPVGHVKVVQPIETGKISVVGVVEGQAVKAGDILIQLDSLEAEAELDGATKAEIAGWAEAERRKTAIDVVRIGCLTCSNTPAWPDEIPDYVRKREDEVLRSDIREIASTLSNLSDQEAEKIAAIDQSAKSVESQMHLLVTLKERVDMRTELAVQAVGSRASVIDATQTVREAETQLVNDQGKHELALVSLASLKSERVRTVQSFLADQTRKMAEARRTAEAKGWERARAQARLDHMTLRAPVDGIVQNMTVTTLGQVVMPGQELLRIVPSKEMLEIQAYVSNDDVGFVRMGQIATVKVDAFPFSRYGTLPARVTGISQDAIPSSTADEAIMDHSQTSSRSRQSLTPSAKPMTDMVFATTLQLDKTQLLVDGRPMTLKPGMTVSIEIKTGTRRIFDYLAAPLIEVNAAALHER